jgi:hypothetical protein
MRWSLNKSWILGMTFPGDVSYHDSLWAGWERRIQLSHAAEEKEIARRYEAWEKNLPDGYDAGDFAADDHWQMERVTRDMYAAIVVSIWSQMERVLTNILALYYERHLEQVQQFCQDTLAGEHTTVDVGGCIRALEAMQTGVSFRIDEIKKAFKDDVCVPVEQCKGYKVVDAIRILNNSFKHANGRYRGEKGQIDKPLLSRWAIVDEHNKIDYTHFCVKEAIEACNAFCHDLLSRVEEKLPEKKT